MRIDGQGRRLNAELMDALATGCLTDRRDRAFFVKLVHGTLEYRYQSDCVIARFSRTKPEKLRPLILELLRMSVYQILHLDRVPDSAVINEAVRIAKQRHLQGLAGYVNGVLRSVSREKASLDLGSRPVRFSASPRLLALLDESIGKEAADRLLGLSLREPGVSVRLLFPEEKEAVAEELRQAGAAVRENPVFPDMLFLENVAGPAGLRPFAEGRIVIQDTSSTVPVRCAGIRENDTVIDVCAAPGGKTLQAAQLCRGGKVLAFDVNEAKTSRIRANAERCGMDNILVSEADARVFLPELEGRADVVLADLPCSGLGTIARKPDVKNRICREDCISLASLQAEILDNVCRYVRPGGTLVYSTCTVTLCENEENLAAFLERHPQFAPADLRGTLPGILCADTLKEGYIRVLPREGLPVDGFFAAVLRKTGEEQA